MHNCLMSIVPVTTAQVTGPGCIITMVYGTLIPRLNGLFMALTLLNLADLVLI